MTSRIYSSLALIATLALSALSLMGCNNQNDMTIEYSKPSQTEWDRFKQLHIAFGHQSVGNNLLAGVRSLAQEQNIDLPIADSATTGDAVVIRQFPIGENGNPNSKLDAFREALAQGAGSYANVAQMKFCYIDFPTSVDPKALAASYIQQTTELSIQYPNAVFVVTTTPLTTIQTGPKAWLKRALGKQPAGYAENLRRHEFNQALRSHYGSNPALFDLAAIESLQGASSVDINNKSVEVLPPAITDDGGHLNDLGQRLVASAWIRHLSTLKLSTHEEPMTNENNSATVQP